MNRPRLYPGHVHRWAEDLLGTPMLRCTICGLQAPRNTVRSQTIPVTDQGVAT